MRDQCSRSISPYGGVAEEKDWRLSPFLYFVQSFFCWPYCQAAKASRNMVSVARTAPPNSLWRLGALRNLPAFLKLVWQTSPGLCAAQALLRLVRAVLPAAALYVGALIIDEVVRLAREPSP